METGEAGGRREGVRSGVVGDSSETSTLPCVVARGGGFGGRPPPPPPSPVKVSDVSVRSLLATERVRRRQRSIHGGQPPTNLLMIRDVSFPIPFSSESGMMHNVAWYKM